MTIPALRREILVAADPALAFEVFVERIGQWWPVGTHSVHGEGGTVAFDGGEIVEVGRDGDRAIWGTVTSWEPGHEVAFSWHPGHGPDRAGHVTVSFLPDPGGTLVRLVHDGWEVYPEPEQARTEYGEGWPFVLGRFRDLGVGATDAAH